MNAHKPETRRIGQRKMSKQEEEISETVGQNIKALRAMAGMSQSTLAEKIGVTFQQVQKYESGVNRVSAPKLLIMSKLFGTPVATFFADCGLDGGRSTFGQSGLRAAQMVEALSPKMQEVALKFLKSLSPDDESDAA